jgi:predicted short-subunit dehydrogenase-like oxidoreductase (DUF2520 family)
MAQRSPRLSVIGAGTVGTTLAVALAAKGYEVSSVVSRTGSRALALAKAVRCARASTSVADLSPETEILLVTVPDGAIAEVAKQVAAVKHLRFKKMFIAHTSGVHAADVLAPVKRKGAAVGSVHPIQSFPRQLAPAQLRSRLRGIYYGVDGEPLAIRKAENLVADLGGRAVEIPAELRPLYHVACVFASSYLMVLTNAISELSGALPLGRSWTEVFGPLMTASMEHTVRHSAAEALTGPILRKDDATIDAHLAALAERAPHLLPLYTVSGIEVARLARRGGQLSPEDFDRLVQRFRKFIKSQPTTNLKVKT